MEIDQTMNRWFEEALTMLHDQSTRQSEIDGFCLGVVVSVKTYLNGTSLLLENDFSFPAMAHLRIVAELIVKFLWCLQGKTDMEIQRRINRWEKTTFRKQKQLLQELVDVIDDNDLKLVFTNIIIKLDSKIKSNKEKEMPNTTGSGGLFEKTRNLFQRNVYPQAYQQFNPAVHIDTDTLKKITASQQSKEGPIKDIKLTQCDKDNLKIFSLSFTYMVLKMLYHHYQKNFGDFEKEYKEVISYHTAKS